MRTAGQRISGWLLAAALLLQLPWPTGGDKICLKALPLPPFPSAACERDCCDHAAATATAIFDLPAMPVEDDCCIACARDTWFKCETRPELRMSMAFAGPAVVATPLLVRAAGGGCVNDAGRRGGLALAHLDTVILRL